MTPLSLALFPFSLPVLAVICLSTDRDVNVAHYGGVFQPIVAAVRWCALEWAQESQEKLR